MEYCYNCKWHIGYTGVCTCPDSDFLADFTDDEFCCDQWESEGDNAGKDV